MAPNILGFPVLELLPDAVFEHDKKSPESYILKKTKNKKLFFSKQCYSLLYHTNYFPDLTLNTF